MSGEVEILCLGDSAVIPDLGLTMSRGSRVSVTFFAASRSRDLEVAKSSGIVGVRPIKATVVRTHANQPPPRQSVDAEKNLLAVQRAASPVAPASVNTATLEQALRDLTAEVRQLRQELHAHQATQPSPADTASIVEAIRSALSGLTIAAPVVGEQRTTVFHAAADEERFIPSGIVPTNLKADISPHTTNEGAGSLEDAQAALREARRRARET